MNIDLGPIILAFAAYYSVLALLIVSLFSLAVWGTVRLWSKSRRAHHFRSDFGRLQRGYS